MYVSLYNSVKNVEIREIVQQFEYFIYNDKDVFLRFYTNILSSKGWHLLQNVFYKGISDMNNFSFIQTNLVIVKILVVVQSSSIDKVSQR